MTLRKRDPQQKQKMKLNDNTRENTNKAPIKLDDTVLVRRDEHVTRIKPPYRLEQYRVTSKKGPMITASKEQFTGFLNSELVERMFC
ncbi:hypothetical protein ScPMuIL_016368 [Solemya velum]